MMRIVVAVLVLLALARPSEAIKAFPGAEGFGARLGGRARARASTISGNGAFWSLSCRRRIVTSSFAPVVTRSSGDGRRCMGVTPTRCRAWVVPRD